MGFKKNQILSQEKYVCKNPKQKYKYKYKKGQNILTFACVLTFTENEQENGNF